jgi:hypothetical protein
MRRLSGIGLVVAMAVGCGGYQQRVREENLAAQDAELQKRAAFDLSCPADKLLLTRLSDTTRGVEGCGAKATYVRVDMSWVMNTINGAVAPLSADAAKGTTP